MMRFTGLLLLTLVGLGSCQVEQDQIQALTKAYTRAAGNSLTFYGAVTKGVLPQLWITDDEATGNVILNVRVFVGVCVCVSAIYFFP